MKILLVILCLLLTGCRIDYRVTINSKNEYNESVDILKYFYNNITVVDDEFGEGKYDIAASLRAQARGYLSNIGYSDFKVKDVSATNYEGIRVERTYTSTSSYMYDVLIDYLYNDFLVENNDGIVTIKATGFDREKISSMYQILDLEIDNSSIVVDLPFLVVNHNADKVDKDSNVYTWYINADTVTKDIELSYDLNNVYAFNAKTIGVKVNLTVLYIAIIILVIAMIGGFGYLWIKRIYENRNKF